MTNSRNPYRIEPPFSVAFSGGASSAFMLHQIIDAWEGKLPEGSAVLFANTGLEHEKTLEFVREVDRRWSVGIVWLEYDEQDRFRVVNFQTASRNGEPFSSLVRQKNCLPTPVARFCTSNLKMRAMIHYLKSIGWIEWDNAIGLRADEPRRAQRIKADYACETPICPMYEAGHTLEDVERFWESQDFRLEIPRWLGNCCGCFLKSRGRIEMVAEQHPELLRWWSTTEQELGIPFRLDRPSYENILTQVSIQGRLFDDDGSTMPCSCTE
jgi:3'-phosphoadenosine 5'-phosphosulfate sulfotransferase (PAPS reductase)/FAD synthetase